MGNGLYVCGYAMKSGKLYIKISLSFLAVLFITLIVIFALFLVSPGKHFTTRLEEHTKTKVLIVKEVVEDKMRSAPTTDLSKNEQLRDFILMFGEILGAEVWLQRQDGTVPLKSFSDGIPPIGEIVRESRPKDFGSFTLYRPRRSHFYAVVPIALPDGENIGIHILFGRQEPPSPEQGFALGLAIIGLIIALLIIPISRFIIKPLKGLSQSALQIAEGDLSHRAVVNSKDEIGELCQSFNHMADKVEKMIKGGRELTANISHELRTPLTRIRVAVELLQERWKRGGDEECAPHLKGMQEDIEELDRLIDNILVLSKLDMHEVPLRRERVDVSELINELLKRLRPTMSRKRLYVSTDLSSDATIFADQDALCTAISNILDNTVKFTPEKGVVIVKVNLERDDLHLSVTNSSETLSEEDLNRIFDPFHRLERSREAGSGLGLAIAKKIIERHWGEIRANNTKEGLQIHISLPKASTA